MVECGCLLFPDLVLERSSPAWRMVSFSRRRVVDASSVFGDDLSSPLGHWSVGSSQETYV
ncbi:unnamed protein product [Brassica rapa subsp. narinosa]